MLIALIVCTILIGFFVGVFAGGFMALHGLHREIEGGTVAIGNEIYETKRMPRG